MVVKTDTVDTTISLSDIDLIIVESPYTTITAALLSHLARYDVSIVFVDDTYMPSSMAHGIFKHSRVSSIQNAQISLSKPRKNKLWKSIVAQKIHNQAEVLHAVTGNVELYGFIRRIQSGDKTNIEAVAASYYFHDLFGSKFVRKNDLDLRNSALNYGYAILRSSIARYLIGYGLNPSFGIWHASSLNGYNLADDLLESFRPVIDYYVVRNIPDEGYLDKDIRYDLVSLTNQTVFSYDGKTTVLRDAMRQSVASYQSYLFGKREGLELFDLGLAK